MAGASGCSKGRDRDCKRGQCAEGQSNSHDGGNQASGKDQDQVGGSQHRRQRHFNGVSGDIDIDDKVITVQGEADVDVGDPGRMDGRDTSSPTLTTTTNIMDYAESYAKLPGTKREPGTTCAVELDQ
jgi:hypothetical protein